MKMKASGKSWIVGIGTTLCLFLSFLDYHSDNHKRYFQQFNLWVNSINFGPLLSPGHSPFQPGHVPRPCAATTERANWQELS